MTPISALPHPGCLGERDGDGEAWEETNDGEEAAGSVEIARGGQRRIMEEASQPSEAPNPFPFMLFLLFVKIAPRALSQALR